MTKYLLPNMPRDVRESVLSLVYLETLTNEQCAAEYGADDATAYADNAAENLAARLIELFPELAERVERCDGAGDYARGWDIAWYLVEQERYIAASARGGAEFVAETRRKIRKEAYSFSTLGHEYEVTQPKGRGAWTVLHVGSGDTFTTAALSLAPARIARDAAERDAVALWTR